MSYRLLLGIAMARVLQTRHATSPELPRTEPGPVCSGTVRVRAVSQRFGPTAAQRRPGGVRGLDSSALRVHRLASAALPDQRQSDCPRADFSRTLAVATAFFGLWALRRAAGRTV